MQCGSMFNLGLGGSDGGMKPKKYKDFGISETVPTIVISGCGEVPRWLVKDPEDDSHFEDVQTFRLGLVTGVACH